jgi:hypothetical protein
VKIKTREALKTIKSFDRADSLAQKSRKGVSSLHNSAEQTQGVGYESETDYAGSELQDKEERIARTTVAGAGRVGRWGVKETRKNVDKWRNRPKKPKLSPKLKQLPSPQRQALPPAKKGTKTTTKATVKGTKTTAKSSAKAAQALKKASSAAVKSVQAASKAVVAATKATVAAVKGVVAAIVAGGWVAVLIIVIMVLAALVAGSVYAIFVPDENCEITIYSVRSDLEREYRHKQSDLIAGQQYDILNYEGDMAPWNEMLAVYAVKLNLGDEPQEVVRFDENKAEQLREIFWDMNEVTTRTESMTSTVIRYETDDEGNLVEIQEEVTLIVLIVVTDNMSADEIAVEYGFTEKQVGMLDDLLSADNAKMWADLIGE